MSNGSTTMARLPHIVTSAMAVTTSSSRFFVTPSIAATADAPQIENPVATRRLVPLDRPIARPSSCVPKNVMVTITTTIARPRPPRCSTSPIASFRPSSTIPARSSFFAAYPSPGFSTARSTPTLPRMAPRITAIVSGLSDGSARFTAKATATAPAATASPGIRGRIAPSIRV